MNPQTFVFFGIVGSGKGTQVKLLVEYLKQKYEYECVYIGTGEIFREILNSSPGTDFEREAVRGILTSGRLMPDETTNKLVLEKIEAEVSSDKSAIFDGYPRTVIQSKFFEEVMKKYNRNKINIIYISLSGREAMKRNLLRARDDDTEEGLKKRFEEYKNKVVPAMNYFKDKDGYKIYEINGEQSVEQVHQEIKSKLGI